MPIYEYRCQSCGAELEKLQKISDPPLVECPECGRETLVKLVSASSFRLKGSGWYETDFKTGRKKNGVGDAPSDASAESKEGKESSAAPTPPAPESAKAESKASDDAGKKEPTAKNESSKKKENTGSASTGKANKPAPKA